MCFSLPGHQDKLGVAETKLLHTLHWMLLEAPQDCSNDRFGGDRGSSWGGSSSAFIHQAENQGSPGPRPITTNDEEENNRRKFFQNSMATVELFVFLFAPLVHRIKVSRTPMECLCGDTSEQRKNDSASVMFWVLHLIQPTVHIDWPLTDILSCWYNTTDIRRESFQQHEQSLYHARRHKGKWIWSEEFLYSRNVKDLWPIWIPQKRWQALMCSYDSVVAHKGLASFSEIPLWSCCWGWLLSLLIILMLITKIAF